MEAYSHTFFLQQLRCQYTCLSGWNLSKLNCLQRGDVQKRRLYNPIHTLTITDSRGTPCTVKMLCIFCAVSSIDDMSSCSLQLIRTTYGPAIRSPMAFANSKNYIIKETGSINIHRRPPAGSSDRATHQLVDYPRNARLSVLLEPEGALSSGQSRKSISNKRWTRYLLWPC